MGAGDGKGDVGGAPITSSFLFYFFECCFKDFCLFREKIFRVKVREGEREGEKHQCGKETIDQLPLVHALTRDRTHNPGLCPDRE